MIVVPDSAHEVATRRFDLLISNQQDVVNVRRDAIAIGSGTITIGNWTRDADCCWASLSTLSTDPRLSVVVEVGLSVRTTPCPRRSRLARASFFICNTCDHDQYRTRDPQNHCQPMRARFLRIWHHNGVMSFGASYCVHQIVSSKQYYIHYS